MNLDAAEDVECENETVMVRSGLTRGLRGEAATDSHFAGQIPELAKRRQERNACPSQLTSPLSTLASEP
jgi:hypothetical protein